MHDDELTPAEREAMRSLPREAHPGDLLEERTVRALAGRGWIRTRRRIPAPLGWAAAVAACVLFFVAGFSIGKNRVEGPGREPLVDSPTKTDREPAFTEAPDAERQSSEISLATTDTSEAGSTSASRTQYVVWF
jgi:hypothetical protein